MKDIVYICLLLLAFNSAHSAELFGVDLISSTKASLSAAVKNAGAQPLKMAGKFDFFDEYRSDKILTGSDKLYLGFSKKDQKFAFAEYEFKGINNKKMLLKLKHKYGKAKKIKGTFISDDIYQWQSGGVQIEFTKDWNNYKTRVSYVVPNLLAELKRDQKIVQQALLRGELSKQNTIF